jgi:predicted transcriptional regulator
MELKMTKAAAVLKLLQKGYSAKDIQEQLGVSLSYVHMLKKKLAEGVGEVVETVRQTATEHTNKVREMIEDWRAEAEGDWRAEGEADTDVDVILDERAATYGSFEDVAGFAQEMKNAIRMCNNSELDDDQIEALDMIASKIARIVNGNPNHIDSWIDIAGYATLVADRLQGKVR